MKTERERQGGREKRACSSAKLPEWVVVPFAVLMDSNHTRDCPYRALLYMNSVPYHSAQKRPKKKKMAPKKDLNASLLSPDKH